MNNVKKLLGLVMALVLTLSLATPAVAAENSYSITINSKTDGHTYQAYQIFSGDLTERTEAGVTTTILANIQWGQGVDDAGLLEALATYDADAFTTGMTAQAVADKLMDYSSEKLDAIAKLVADNLGTAASGTFQETGSATAGYEYTMTNLDAGYYFINEAAFTGDPVNNAYTKYMIQVVGDVEVTAKTDLPAVVKKVKENGAGLHPNTWNDAADYNVGDSVPFRLVGVVPDMSNYETYYYRFNDTLSAGLTFEDNVTVYYVATGNISSVVTSTEVGANGTRLTAGYAVVPTENADGTTDFTVAFTDLKATLEDANLTAANTTTGGFIVVEYTAVLNSDAVIGNPGNPNVVTLTYSNNPNNSGAGATNPSHGETPEDEVVVFTFELPVNKVDGSDHQITLSGAVFALFWDVDSANAVAANPTSEASLALLTSEALTFSATATVGTYLRATGNGTTYALSGSASGAYHLQGLDQGTYYLVELEAPAGYNRLDTATTVVLSAEYEPDKYEDEHQFPDKNDQLLHVAVNGTNGAALDVENNSGATLPSTGGMGTTLFTVGGIVLMAVAAVLLVTKRKLTDGE